MSLYFLPCNIIFASILISWQIINTPNTTLPFAFFFNPHYSYIQEHLIPSTSISSLYFNCSSWLIDLSILPKKYCHDLIPNTRKLFIHPSFSLHYFYLMVYFIQDISFDSESIWLRFVVFALIRRPWHCLLVCSEVKSALVKITEWWLVRLFGRGS